jgi:hypothetical protein
MSTIIGYVKNIDGKYFAKDANGKIRGLKEGDPVYQNDIVFGGETNAGDSTIEIAFWDGGKQLILAGNDPLNVDTALLRTVFLSEEPKLYAHEVMGEIESINDYSGNLNDKILKNDGKENQKTSSAENSKPMESAVSINESITQNRVEASTQLITDVKENVWIDPFFNDKPTIETFYSPKTDLIILDQPTVIPTLTVTNVTVTRVPHMRYLPYQE